MRQASTTRRSISANLALACATVAIPAFTSGHSKAAPSPAKNLGGSMPKATQNLGHDYSAAWSSKSAAAVASFYSADGQIIINGGEPMSGHKAIAEMAAGFYAAFPDLIVRCDDFRVAGKHAWQQEIARILLPLEGR